MATVSAPVATPSSTGREQRTARRLLPAAATVAGVAVLLRLVFDPWYLNYDARYALL
jgi:hypothetical protein